MNVSKKIGSLLLCAVMLLSLFPTAVFAGDEESGTLICGKDEHTHSDACYTQLICTKEETAGHTHTDACYDQESNLICGQDATERHTHSVAEGCYALSCGLTEHTHTNDCYEKQEQNTQLQVVTVSTWEWVIEEGLDFQLDDQGRYIAGELSDRAYLPSGNEIAEVLPQAVTVNGDKETKIPVTWTCEAYDSWCESAEPGENGYLNGTFDFTAELPEGYALAEGAEELVIPVLFGTGVNDQTPSEQKPDTEPVSDSLDNAGITSLTQTFQGYITRLENAIYELEAALNQQDSLTSDEITAISDLIDTAKQATAQEYTYGAGIDETLKSKLIKSMESTDRLRSQAESLLWTYLEESANQSANKEIYAARLKAEISSFILYYEREKSTIPEEYKEDFYIAMANQCLLYQDDLLRYQVEYKLDETAMASLFTSENQGNLIEKIKTIESEAEKNITKQSVSAWSWYKYETDTAPRTCYVYVTDSSVDTWKEAMVSTYLLNNGFRCVYSGGQELYIKKWTCEAFPNDGTTDGVYKFTAELYGTHQWDDSVTPPTVYVYLGEDINLAPVTIGLELPEAVKTSTEIQYTVSLTNTGYSGETLAFPVSLYNAQTNEGTYRIGTFTRQNDGSYTYSFTLGYGAKKNGPNVAILDLPVGTDYVVQETVTKGADALKGYRETVELLASGEISYTEQLTLTNGSTPALWVRQNTNNVTFAYVDETAKANIVLTKKIGELFTLEEKDIKKTRKIKTIVQEVVDGQALPLAENEKALTAMTAAADAESYGPFTFLLTLTDLNGTAYTKPIQVTDGSETKTVTVNENGKYEITVTALDTENTQTTGEYPTGSVTISVDDSVNFTLSEKKAAGYTFSGWSIGRGSTDSAGNCMGTVGLGGTVTATAYNEANSDTTGGIALIKEIQNISEEEKENLKNEEFTFTVHVSTVGPDGTMIPYAGEATLRMLDTSSSTSVATESKINFDAKGNYPVTLTLQKSAWIDGLPDGAYFTVTEAENETYVLLDYAQIGKEETSLEYEYYAKRMEVQTTALRHKNSLRLLDYTSSLSGTVEGGYNKYYVANNVPKKTAGQLTLTKKVIDQRSSTSERYYFRITIDGDVSKVYTNDDIIISSEVKEVE